VTISCRYCIALEVMLLVSSLSFGLGLGLETWSLGVGLLDNITGSTTPLGTGAGPGLVKT